MTNSFQKAINVLSTFDHFKCSECKEAYDINEVPEILARHPTSNKLVAICEGCYLSAEVEYTQAEPSLFVDPDVLSEEE